MLKTCSYCREIKSLDFFCKKSSRCKTCRAEYKNQYYQKNKHIIALKQKKYRIDNSEAVKLTHKKWRIKNAEKIKLKKREYNKKNKEKINLVNKKYRHENKEKIKNINKNYIKNNLDARIRLNQAIKNLSKNGSAVRDLGCSILEFKMHIEKLFKPGMSWENKGRYGWHFDHIIPLSHFDLSKKEQFLKAVHYTNIQPLWWYENLSKNNKLDSVKIDVQNKSLEIDADGK